MKDISILVISLLSAFLLSIQFSALDVEEHITTVFVFAVFLVSLFTSSYIYGVVASIVGVVLINYAFMYPFFAFDFINPVNLVSAVIMLTVSIVTSLLVSKRKESEKKLRESENERIRADLLRAVSHDLRTPLTTIESASSLLLDNNNLPIDKKREMLENIKEESIWLERMVENLLSITRLGERGIKIEKKSVIVDELVDSVVNKFHNRYENENIEVFLPDEITAVMADPLLIEEVLLNLLDNAHKHAEGHTKITLSVRKDEDNVIFSVLDNGCGLGKEGENIFSSYGTDGDRNRYKGIGLSVAKTIITGHGGSITAHDRECGGAEFSFTLGGEI